MYKSTHPKKKEESQNINVFSDFKVIYNLTKKHSPNAVVIIQDKDDDWFYYVVTYRAKSGIITDSSMIIGSDLDSWINSLKRGGYEEVKK